MDDRSTQRVTDLEYKLTKNLASLNGGYLALSGSVTYLLAPWDRSYWDCWRHITRVHPNLGQGHQDDRCLLHGRQ